MAVPLSIGLYGGSIIAMISTMHSLRCIHDQFCSPLGIPDGACQQVVDLAVTSLKDLETLPFTLETAPSHHIAAVNASPAQVVVS